ncbi:unnamed protein product [Fraxinus pennsylvanica]|uniref:Uncharacterized protein n=1 Tax=Fraxinus pennsylvanica TaxID=56036 RepID=A0AAD2AD40_9LAMI|nr:unnamed protein product [Fraxinus pennsylvanica]
MTSQKLSIYTTRHDTILRFPLQVIGAAVFSEPPFPADNNLLAAREFELSTAQCFLGVVAVVIFAANRKKNLTNSNTRGGRGRVKGKGGTLLPFISVTVAAASQQRC